MHVAEAHDTAADAVHRFQDAVQDSGRAAAHAFTEELARLSQLTTQTNDARQATEEWGHQMNALGALAANLASSVGHAIGVIVGLVGTAVGAVTAPIMVAAAGIEALPRGLAAARAAVSHAMHEQATDGIAAQSWRFTTNQANQLEALYNDREYDRTSLAPTAAAAAAVQSGAGEHLRHESGPGAGVESLRRQQRDAINRAIEEATIAARTDHCGMKRYTAPKLKSVDVAG